VVASRSSLNWPSALRHCGGGANRAMTGINFSDFSVWPKVDGMRLQRVDPRKRPFQL
jgi:hypothetical protein